MPVGVDVGTGESDMSRLRFARISAHLAVGVVQAALLLPRATPARRQALISAWSVKLLALFGMRLVVHQVGETLDAGALVIGNHVSWIDIYVINAWRPTPFVAKAEIAEWPVIGFLAKQLGTIFIKREKRSDARRIVERLSDELRSGRCVCVFPEGTTSDGLDLLPFHANLLQSAVAAGAPLQPICILYEDGAGRQTSAPAYIGELSLLESARRTLSAAPLTAHLYVGAPLPPGTDRRALAADVRQAVRCALTEMQAMVLPVADASVLDALPSDSRGELA